MRKTHEKAVVDRTGKKGYNKTVQRHCGFAEALPLQIKEIFY